MIFCIIMRMKGVGNIRNTRKLKGFRRLVEESGVLKGKGLLGLARILRS